PARCACPTNSSSEVGLILSARGILPAAFSLIFIFLKSLKSAKGSFFISINHFFYLRETMKCKLLILSFLSVFFVAQSQTGNSYYKEIGAPMPAIRLVVPPLTVNESTAKKGKKVATPQNQIVTEKELKNDANLLVMMFNPTCGHC